MQRLDGKVFLLLQVPLFLALQGCGNALSVWATMMNTDYGKRSTYTDDLVVTIQPETVEIKLNAHVVGVRY